MDKDPFVSMLILLTDKITQQESELAVLRTLLDDMLPKLSGQAKLGDDVLLARLSGRLDALDDEMQRLQTAHDADRDELLQLRERIRNREPETIAAPPSRDDNTSKYVLRSTTKKGSRDWVYHYISHPAMGAPHYTISNDLQEAITWQTWEGANEDQDTFLIQPDFSPVSWEVALRDEAKRQAPTIGIASTSSDCASYDAIFASFENPTNVDPNARPFRDEADHHRPMVEDDATPAAPCATRPASSDTADDDIPF